MPLPGGWRELLEYLANVGYNQIEFAGYGQNASNPGGAAPNPAPGGVTTPESRAAYLAYGRTLRGFLDEFGLEAIGNHGFIPNTWPGPGSAGGAMSTNDYERFQTELEFASILGMPFMGTGNDPTSANNRNIEPWTLAGEKWEALNTLSLAWGIHLYPHNHSPAYNFLQDGPIRDRHRGPSDRRADPTDRRSGASRASASCSTISTSRTRTCAKSRWTSIGHTSPSTNGAGATTGTAIESRTSSIRLPLSHGRLSDTRCITPRTGTERQSPLGVGNGYNFIPFGDPRSDIDFETFFKNQGAGATTTRTTSRTTPRAVPPTPGSPCGSRRSAHTT